MIFPWMKCLRSFRFEHDLEKQGILSDLQAMISLSRTCYMVRKGDPIATALLNTHKMGIKYKFDV